MRGFRFGRLRVPPFWVANLIAYLGITLLIFYPLGVLVGEAWTAYGLCIIGGVVYSGWANKRYRRTIIERSDRHVVSRIERRSG